MEIDVLRHVVVGPLDVRFVKRRAETFQSPLLACFRYTSLDLDVALSRMLQGGSAQLAGLIVVPAMSGQRRERGGVTLGKPTRYEVLDGNF